MWQLDSGNKVAQFTADEEIHSCEVISDATVVAGGGLGRIHFLKLV